MMSPQIHPRLVDFLQEFESTVQAFPDKIAVMTEGAFLTYACLNARANQLARHFQRKGIRIETIVIVFLERSLETIIAFLATLKADAVYLPLDPHFTPHARLSWMIDNTQEAVILTQTCFQNDFRNYSGAILLWEDVSLSCQQEPSANFSRNRISDNLAYIMYTSGSTGHPKGVMLSHGNISHCARDMQEPIGIIPADRYLHTASFAFSSSIRQLAVPLCSGATLVLAPSSVLRDPYELFLLIQRTDVTIMDIVPSFWRNCLETLSNLAPPLLSTILRNSLRIILSASEALLAGIPYRWSLMRKDNTRFVNMYGQTETAGIVLTHSFLPTLDGDTEASVPLGKPITNIGVSILSPNLDSMAKGTSGEIHISGAGLARGYLNLPGVTAKNFIPDPHAQEPGSRMYCTGDNGYNDARENIIFQGRQDSQVKIRGHRIEIGEIERALYRHPQIAHGLLVKKMSTAGDTSLMAFVLLQPGTEMTKREVIEYLQDMLPFYMIPEDVTFLDHLPLTVTGKIDRFALLESVRPDPTLWTKPVPPLSLWEARIADIWKEVLEMEVLDTQDNFFHVGGHSLKAIQIINRIRKAYNISLPIQTIFDYPTVASLARKVENFI
ncbi:MAG: amino acid adenylation domain-containing protein [Nitrospirales bacterium]